MAAKMAERIESLQKSKKDSEVSTGKEQVCSSSLVNLTTPAQNNNPPLDKGLGGS
jgi:hypothetical protein